MSHSANLLSTDIAVVGMACRLPGAPNVRKFWRNLRDGVESVTVYSEAELLAAGEEADLLKDPHYVRSGAPLADMESFDAGFFGFSPREASIMDPQHRHFLEVAWEALEDAGHPPETFDGSIGVFAGSGMHAYYVHHLAPNRKLMRQVGAFLVRHTGNDKDFLTTRASYCLNLRGPSVNIQTACSTSLVAVHTACQSLLNGECDMALAGGVTIEVPHRRGYVYQEGEILSPDGHCRAFDHRSQGTIFGSGVGVVVLRRATEALEAGDTLYAIVRGSAINNDGSSKVGYLAPSVDGQAECIAQAMAAAGVEPDSISFVEAHGTGTPVGDPIEIAALTQVYRRHTARTGYCAIGSVKTNVGHLDTAAGVAAMMKAVLALRHRILPPSLNFEAPNPLCDIPSSPFFVNAQGTDWVSGETPRRAAVNSLGVGGTNAHVILEEAPEPLPLPSRRSDRLLCFSARSAHALDDAGRQFVEFLKEYPDVDLADAAFTLQTGRRSFKHRRVLACGTTMDAIAALEANDKRRVFQQVAADGEPGVIFMFPGGGSQHPGMGRELYRTEPVFRGYVDEGLRQVKSRWGLDLERWIFPVAGDEEEATTQLEQAANSILSVFIVEHALARLWMSLGVKPVALTGHSLGEYTAACLAGVLSFEDALGIVAARGRVFARLPEGAMLSVGLSEAEIRSHLGPQHDLAAINLPELCVVSGTVGDIAELEASLQSKEIECQRLRIAVAAHSHMLEPFLAEFEKEVAAARLSPPNIPFISNLTGKWARADEVVRPEYWVRHLRQTVRFASGLSELLEKETNAVLLEVGPGTTLTSLVRMHPSKSPAHSVTASLPHPKDNVSDAQSFLSALGRLWLAGRKVDWSAFYGDERRRRISLPTYPWEHRRHWIDAPNTVVSEAPEVTPVASPVSTLTKESRLDLWFSQPVWKMVPAGPASSPGKEGWLLFADEHPLHRSLEERLRARGEDVVVVTRGAAFVKTGGDRVSVRPGEREDFDSLVGMLADEKRVPGRMLHLWGWTDGADAETDLDTQIDAHFFSLLFFAQALAMHDITRRIHIGVVTRGMQRVAEEPVSSPEKALALGPCLVIPKEFRNLSCTSIDVEGPERDPERTDGVPGLIDRVVAEMTAQSPPPVVALRESGRWELVFEPCQVPQPRAGQIVWRERGVYVITGGLGAIGGVVAEHLARTARARLVLTGRRALPPREDWDGWLSGHADSDKVSGRIRTIRHIEDLGGEVLSLVVDVSDPDQMRSMVQTVLGQFGRVDGVFHAAGVLEDGAIETRTRDSVERVLAPKVHGTLALERALSGVPLDFMILFSSTSSILGPATQVDYTAANAFLNAFAQSRHRADGTRVIALNWGIWAEVGMAVRSLVQQEGDVPGEPTAHSLLGKCVQRTPDRLVFSAQYSTADTWVLDEHRIKGGNALIPATGYLELARAAIEECSGPGPVEIRNLYCLKPLEVRNGDVTEVRIALDRSGDSWQWVVSSRDGLGWFEHAQAELALSAGPTAGRLDPAALAARCAQREVQWAPNEQETRQEAHLLFGPRWKVLRGVRFGDREALGTCELPEAFAADLATFKAHPAMVDLALHCGLPLLEGYEDCTELFVPMSFKRVQWLRDIPHRILAHVRLTGNGSALDEVVTFDITLMDETGQVVCEVEEFTLRRIGSGGIAAAGTARPGRLVQAGKAGNSVLEQMLEHGIVPREGVEVLERVIAGNCPPHIVASSIPLPLLENFRGAGGTGAKHRDTGSDSQAAAHEADGPRDEIERTLCQLWQELLGVDRVGIRDDFFELGGHSLIGVRLFTRLKKQYKVEFGLAVLFEAPTIVKCADLVRQALGIPAPDVASEGASNTPPEPARRLAPAIVPIKATGTRTPLFGVHGMGGNVVEFQHLSRYLDADQPFYGIQAYGMNRGQSILYQVEEMASRYIDDIKTVQPSGPYYLCGSSFGGLVSFEMAHQLTQRGEHVGAVILFDSYGNGYPKALPGSVWLGRLLRAQKYRISLHATNLRHLKLVEWPEYIQEKVGKLPRRFRRWRKRVGASFTRFVKLRMLPRALREQAQLAREDVDAMLKVKLPPELQRVQAASVKAAKRYVARPYDGRVVLFRAANQPEGIVENPSNGWADVVRGPFEIIEVPGHHGAMIREPHARTTSAHLEKVLQELQSLEER